MLKRTILQVRAKQESEFVRRELLQILATAVRYFETLGTVQSLGLVSFSTQAIGWIWPNYSGPEFVATAFKVG